MQETPRGTLVIVRRDDPDKRPVCKPDPDYPNGVILDCAQGSPERCDIALPYPARGLGTYQVRCDTCLVRITLTVAGRPDDPARIILPCSQHLRAPVRRAA